MQSASLSHSDMYWVVVVDDHGGEVSEDVLSRHLNALAQTDRQPQQHISASVDSLNFWAAKMVGMEQLKR
jgi:hypothetical protein